MATLTYTIDCGFAGPFKEGRTIQRPSEDADQITISLLASGSMPGIDILATKQVFNVDVVGYRGIVNGKNAGFFFDSSRNRMVGMVHEQDHSTQGVFSAAGS